MGLSQNTCEVCKEAKQKYRCPKCAIRYCSVGCFKTHKKICLNIPVEEKSGLTINEGCNNGPKEVLEEGEMPSSDNGDKDLVVESEDKVSEEKLTKLSENVDLLHLLANPHLRQMLTHLNTTDDPSGDLDMAMQEPIFLEFVEKCLYTVEEDTN